MMSLQFQLFAGRQKINGAAHEGHFPLSLSNQLYSPVLR
jgi:hypothetical protein